MKKIYNQVLILIGFILSPLSWWNDLVVNFPLSYLIAFPFGLLSKQLFVPAFIAAYWITNILGFLLMHQGTRGLFANQSRKAAGLHDLKKLFIASFLYTLLILFLIYFNILTKQ